MTVEASQSLQTGRLASETGKVQCSVGVPMMFGPTSAAHPLPDPETVSTVWAADASAHRTGSGCIRSLDLPIGHPRVSARVSEEVSQHRPPGIEHTLCHGGLGQPGRRHVANRDPAGPSDQPPGKLVQSILSSGGDLGVDGPDLTLAACSLSRRQLRFQIAVEAGLLQVRAVRAGGDELQSAINADVRLACERHRLDLTDDDAIPLPSSVLRDIARFDFTFDGAVPPQPEALPSQDGGGVPRSVTGARSRATRQRFVEKQGARCRGGTAPPHAAGHGAWLEPPLRGARHGVESMRYALAQPHAPAPWPRRATRSR